MPTILKCSVNNDTYIDKTRLVFVFRYNKKRINLRFTFSILLYFFIHFVFWSFVILLREVVMSCVVSWWLTFVCILPRVTGIRSWGVLANRWHQRSNNRSTIGLVRPQCGACPCVMTTIMCRGEMCVITLWRALW